MLDAMLYILLGIFIACAVQGVFTACKKYRERYERMATSTMRSIFWDELEKVRPHEIRGLQESVEKIIDYKLAEKEGEHETPEL